MSDSLVAFLNARLDEDEQIACDPMATTWTKSDAPSIFVMGDNELVAETTDFCAARHIARHDPARVRAEVAAKRQILVEYETAATFYGKNRHAPAGELHGLHVALRYLASVYVSHPDYRPEWAPDA
ncbi:DUF6221 family protein [Kitasatospora sp. NPDC054939]